MKRKYPEVTIPLNLGVLGLHRARVGYDSRYGDVQYIIVDDHPLYLEIEVETLDGDVQFDIEGLIADDRREREVCAAEAEADRRREEILFDRDQIRGL